MGAAREHPAQPQVALPAPISPAPSPDVMLCRALLGEPPAWPDRDAAWLEQQLLESCHVEAVGPLLHHGLRRSAIAATWPLAMREILAHESRMHAALDMLRESELRIVLCAMDAAGIATLLLKGAALAYTHYASPALRTRCDADVWIRCADRDRAARVLEGMGYVRYDAIAGSLVSYEDAFRKRCGTIEHVVDLHWQVNNGQVFAHALAWQDAYARSVPVPQLGAAVRTPHPPHALLIACMHRAAHLGIEGPGGVRLVWLFDVHLIAGTMRDCDWREFVDDCRTTKMRAIALDALRCTQRLFGTAFPAGVIAALAERSAPELSARYLRPGRAGTLLLTDLRALPTWRKRATLLRESWFPSPDYLLRKFRGHSPWLLPWLYLRRAVEGAWKIARR